MDVHSLIIFLEEYRNAAYVVLFFGSYLETLFPFSLFVYGEIFFIAGPVLAGMGILNIWLIVLVLYAGGVFGDNTSYFLGRKYGKGFFLRFSGNRFFRKYINESNFQKGADFFKKKGKKGVFLARLSGPFSWVTPFLSGVFKMKYGSFLKYNTLGIILGIGEFIVAGYFAGQNYKIILSIMQKYIILIIFVLAIFYILYRRIKMKGEKHN